MIYGEKNRVQAELALYALGVGFLIGLIYVFLSPFRSFLRRRPPALFAGDALYCVAAAFVTFLFLLDYNSGVVRVYLLAAEEAGFLTARAVFSGAMKIIAKKQKKRLQRHCISLYNK